MAAEKRMWVSMTLSMIVGLAYLGWLAWTEGWRLWAVMGVLLLIAGVGGVVHMAMGMARNRDGLEDELVEEAAPEVAGEPLEEE
jgi:hypothetical protein